MKLSDELQRRLAGYSWNEDTDGMSPARVVRLCRGGETLYLKASPPVFTGTTYDVRREHKMLLWLANYARVPRVLHYEETDGWHILLMEELAGEKPDVYFEKGDMAAGLQLYAGAIRQLHAIPVEDCPESAAVPLRLQELDYLLANGLASMDDWEEHTDFSSAEELAAWLHAHAPQEQLVVSHGDISNILVENGEIGFFDLGRCGTADLYYDVAFVLRELQDCPESERWSRYFLQLLGLPAHREKIEYFILLDELF